MLKALGFAAALAFAAPFAAQAQAPKINDAQIAHIAYTAGVIDVAAGKQALAKSKDKAVRDFAAEMVRGPRRGERPGAGAGQEAGRDAAGQSHQPGAEQGTPRPS
jgi:predicted outer membrane protein